MAKISNMNNRIECYVLLSDIEVFTDGTNKLFDESMIINSRKLKD
jgi:hypothetical protein